MFANFTDRTLILFIVFNFYALLVVADEKDDVSSDREGLWFGPRLGKRSLRLSGEDERQTFLQLLEAADTLKYYYNQMYGTQQEEFDPKAVSKKMMFAPKHYEDKRYDNMNFMPRLGRRLPEVRATPSEQESFRQEPAGDPVENRIKLFTPRLGRTLTFSPRLGRDLTYELYPDKVRVVRSANKTKAT